ncbi:phage integrase N-terminal SAM-like domain-containing protein [Bacillus salipaludis]|uniref:Phage integrase N-terminal SAM-like domain-containing protein n=1 Tax=Bacillus salipaludis TaxID=2547811 RepID=A0AA90R8X1_9BACI|nr:phage integrase N-terminal SAM-like domain-containing protein [Bacillus salipaludis]MDQ6598881.1 phage integrase N-terminal SAM-like domain-containing protein [Bacillus salipaludis]
MLHKEDKKNQTRVRQIRHDRHTPDDRYTLHDAVEIFIKAKEAERLRNSTIKGYYDTVRYFRDWLNPDIEYIDEIKSSILRDYINYLKNDRLPYQGSRHQK